MLKFRIKTKVNKGFTLIELVVVIAILGILTTLAVPRLSGFIEKAKIGVDQSTVKTLNSVTDLYMIIDNNDKAQFHAADDDKARIEILSSAGYLKDNIEPQHKDGKFIWGSNSQKWYYGTSEDKPIIIIEKGKPREFVVAIWPSLNEFVNTWDGGLNKREDGSIRFHKNMLNPPLFIDEYFESLSGLDKNLINDFNVFFGEGKEVLGVYAKISKNKHEDAQEAIYFSTEQIMIGKDFRDYIKDNRLVPPSE